MDSSQIAETYGYDKLKIQYGIQTVFSTIPFQSDEEDITHCDESTSFEKHIKKFYFEKFRENLRFEEDEDVLLYKPLKFFMLGDYDVLYVTLINNFKFSHRLFEPIVPNPKNDFVYNAHTFQSYSGFLLNQNEDEKQIQNIFNSAVANNDENVPISYFIGVINLKLNNGLFIGNGLRFIEKVYELIEHKLKELNIYNYLITQTFSWFELSLMIFVDDPEELKETLQHLRALVLNDLEDDLIAKNSLYSDFYTTEEIKDVSLFADTNSHLGFNEQLIRNSFEKSETEGIDDYVYTFLKEAQAIKLKTEIEWQVKPGHIIDLISLIKKDKYLDKIFFDGKGDKKGKHTQSNTSMVLGKCDYYISENDSDSILSNFHLIRYIARNKEVFRHIRKVRTYIFLDNLEYLENNYYEKECSNGQSEKKKIIKWSPILEPLAIKNKEFHEYDGYLKKLKVSRHIRNKILKIFSNFNNGILDPIQFTYFIDTSILIKKLKVFIKHEANLNEEKSTSITEIANKLLVFINTFQEAYYVRFLNGYQFESISDFDLDYNNSIQQLLSSYGILVNHYGKFFYEDGSLYAPVVQLYDLDTVSDLYSINYAVHHFTSPEFVFTTLAKEVLNSVLQEEEFLEIKKTYKGIISRIKEEINESYFDDLIESETFDLNYFIIDCIRLYTTFNGSLEFFQHWIWSYNFQNTSLYDTDGMFNENHLKTEMLRLMMLQEYKHYQDIKNSDDEIILEKNNESFISINCPVSHLESYWFLHFEKLNSITNLIFQNHSDLFFDIFEYIDKKNKAFKKRYSSKHLRLLNDDIIKETLVGHYKFNKEKVAMVNRDWDNGKFCKNNYKQDVVYAIDQIGTQFFYTNSDTQTYFKFNAKIILSVIDYATQHKKDFISELIPNKHEAN